MSEEEVRRLFDVTSNLKHRVLFKTVYSAGLRLSEAICLRPEHIESDTSSMMIRVEQRKGNKDRYTILSRSLLPEVRTYWRKYQPGEWLFPGQKRNRHMGSTTADQIYKKAKKDDIFHTTHAGIGIVPNVKTWSKKNGLMTERRNCCRVVIFIWYLRCRMT
ncbi:MAG: tyrosine-type recombinase/integrase [Desulfobacterales bacterium]|nr:tyrosine-type recombinase/integrase [Desulfobacterales bacterium]